MGSFPLLLSETPEPADNLYGLQNIDEGLWIGFQNCFSQFGKLISGRYSHQHCIAFMTVAAFRIDDGNAVRQKLEAGQHLFPFLRDDEAGQLDVAAVDHIDYTALDENTKHSVKGRIPAFEEAEAKDYQTIHYKEYGAHWNIVFARNNRAKYIKTPGRTPCTKREAYPARNYYPAEDTGKDRVLGQFHQGDDGQKPGSG